MASEYDATEFVDTDFQAAQQRTYSASATGGSLQRAPTPEAQQRLADLKRQQEELERERAAREETRRRQIEFQTGRQEIVQHLTRGLGLLEEAEFTARRDAEQMARTITDFKDALGKVQALNEEHWSKEDFAVELTRALTTVENARMEWNAARLKFPVLSGVPQESPDEATEKAKQPASFLAGCGFGELCRLGLALTWPVALAVLLALGALATIWLSR
jgi:hypothetical protein